MKRPRNTNDKTRTKAALEEAIAEKEGRACTVWGCEGLTIGLHPYCKFHVQRATTIGSPTHSTIPQLELRWWRAKLVRPWLETQRDHAGIREALEVLDVLINTGKQAPYFGPYLTTSQMVRHQWSRLKLNDVSSIDVLEVVFALYSIAWLKPKSFDRAKQGRHFKMVLASKVIHLATRAGQNKIRGRVVGDRSPRLLNIGTRELFSHQITRRLNYISNRAAHAICKGHPEYETETDYVAGGDDAWKAPEALLERPAPYFAP